MENAASQPHQADPLPTEEEQQYPERQERITVQNATYDELRACTKKLPVGPFRYYAPCKQCTSEFERNIRGRGRYALFCCDKCKDDYHNELKKNKVLSDA